MRNASWVIAAICVGVALAPPAVAASVTGGEVFDRIVAKAQKEKWAQLPLHQIMLRVAMELNGTPYVAATLEVSENEEIPSANFVGLDCVTFFETTLDVARMLRKGGHTRDDFMREVQYTRYRGGKPGDYSTRLHYTTDWMFDNQAKKVVEIEDGTVPLTNHVDFMSTHAQLYPALKAHPELVKKMKAIENDVNLRKKLTFVPNAALPIFERKLQTGDIVGIVTDTPGLDISHTGLVVVDEKGIPHFMNASSKAGVNKVVLESDRLSESISSRKHAIGAVFARPIDPK